MSLNRFLGLIGVSLGGTAVIAVIFLAIAVGELRNDRDNAQVQVTSLSASNKTLQDEVKVLKDADQVKTTDIAQLRKDLKGTSDALGNLDKQHFILEGEVYDNLYYNNPTVALQHASTSYQAGNITEARIWLTEALTGYARRANFSCRSVPVTDYFYIDYLFTPDILAKLLPGTGFEVNDTKPGPYGTDQQTSFKVLAYVPGC